MHIKTSGILIGGIGLMLFFWSRIEPEPVPDAPPPIGESGPFFSDRRVVPLVAPDPEPAQPALPAKFQIADMVRFPQESFPDQGVPPGMVLIKGGE